MRKSRTHAGVAGAVMGLVAVLSFSAGPGVGLAAAAQAPARSVGVPVRAARSAVVNMAALAKQAAARPLPGGPSGMMAVPEPLAPPEPGTSVPSFLPQFLPSANGPAPQIASPSPAQDFAGLDDIANSSTGYRYIPPDTDGAVGLTKVMSGLNNAYRIFTKSSGAVVSTVSTDAFWTGLGGTGFFDPKTLYDPVNDRWIVVMMSDSQSASSSINIGVSQTSDPSGSYYLYRFDADSTNASWADFPTIGFNKDYVAVGFNMHDNVTNAYRNSQVLAVDYPSMRIGTWHAWSLTGSDYCSSPAATYSPTESTLYVPTQVYGTPGTYRVDTITKVAGSPVYAVGALKSRGLTWTQPGGNILPQQGWTIPALKGIDCQDDMIRSTPVVRDGSLYYTQTVGLPAGGTLTHTSILWTRLTASTGSVTDGGLIDDPTATATNGGKWYAYPHIAVNKFGDAIVGFSQFSSAQYASAGYVVRAASDAAGTMRDPLVYRDGLGAYQKDYSTGSNRWGDYSKAQVDPSNDADLWVLDEYAKPVTGSGDNGGVWGTWWARVTAPTSVPATTVTSFAPTSGPVGTGVTITGSGFTGATAVRFHGTAATTWSVVSDVQITATVPAGASTGTVAVDAPGGTGTSAASFTVTVPVPATTVSSFAPISGPVGTGVTITGSGFTGAIAVRFHGTAATTWSVVSDVQITATVPAGATTGTIAVDAPGGTGTSVASFTVTVPVPVPPFVPTITLKLSGLKSGAIELGKRVTGKGTVTPTSLAGSKVTLLVQKKKGGKWRQVKSTTRAIAANGSYSWKYKPAKRGAYRMRSTIAGTATNAAATTKWRAFKVK